MAAFVEGLGYLASVLVALSLTMSNVWRLRWINLGGAIAFITYAAAIAAWPVLLVNAWITGVNVFHLKRMAANRDSFDAFVRPPDDPILLRFVQIYKADIHRFFPDFALETEPSTEYLLVLRNLTPVGLVTYEWSDDKTVYLHTDYVTPAFRDFKNGKSLYEPHTGELARLGVSLVRTQAYVPQHARYLEKMGFAPAADDPAIYEKTLT